MKSNEYKITFITKYGNTLEVLIFAKTKKSAEFEFIKNYEYTDIVSIQLIL